MLTDYTPGPTLTAPGFLFGKWRENIRLTTPGPLCQSARVVNNQQRHNMKVIRLEGPNGCKYELHAYKAGETVKIFPGATGVFGSDAGSKTPGIVYVRRSGGIMAEDNDVDSASLWNWIAEWMQKGLAIASAPLAEHVSSNDKEHDYNAGPMLAWVDSRQKALRFAAADQMYDALTTIYAALSKVEGTADTYQLMAPQMVIPKLRAALAAAGVEPDEERMIDCVLPSRVDRDNTGGE